MVPGAQRPGYRLETHFVRVPVLGPLPRCFRLLGASSIKVVAATAAADWAAMHNKVCPLRSIVKRMFIVKGTFIPLI